MQPIIAANWKMYKTGEEVKNFFNPFLSAFLSSSLPEKCQVWIAPSFTELRLAVQLLHAHSQDVDIRVGAQNISAEPSGPLTGEISASQVAACGGHFVILGHSERRRLFGETASLIKKKISLATAHQLIPLVCVGETNEERAQGKTAAVLEAQLHAILEEDFKGVIAYEPIWAIGSGAPAAPEQIEEAHTLCKQILKKKCKKGEKLPILYGGSVTPETAASIAAIKNVDGVLVGGASLKPESFLSIIQGFIS